MAAARPPAIGDLTDELLVRIFAALPTGSTRDRCTLPRVCRRWRALAASPTGAPLWARVEVEDIDSPAFCQSLLGWFAVRGARVCSLALASMSYDGDPRAWETARAAMSLAPGVEALTIDFSTLPPAGLEWWRPLANGLTRLALWGAGTYALARVGARDALPQSLLDLELGVGVGGRLPPAVRTLTRLTRLEIADIGASEQEASRADFLQELGALRALRSLAFSCDALERVPASVGALTALTHLCLATCPLRPPNALGPLTALSRLAKMFVRADGLRRPSALAGLTSIREMELRYDALKNSDGPIVEPGPYLVGLNLLDFYLLRVQNARPGLIDVHRRVVEPLRAAALTGLVSSATRTRRRRRPRACSSQRTASRRCCRASRRCGAWSSARGRGSRRTARTLPSCAGGTCASSSRSRTAPAAGSAGTAVADSRGAFLLASAPVSKQ
jgi:hypothetical protein